MRVTFGTLNEDDPEPYRTPGVGRATEGRDFVPLLDSVVFLANQSEANITLRVLDDEDPERDESVFVKLISVQLIKGEQERLSKTLTPPHIQDRIIHRSYSKLMKYPLTVSSSFHVSFTGPQH